MHKSLLVLLGLCAIPLVSTTWGMGQEKKAKLEPEPIHIGGVYFSGKIAGVDDDGKPSTATIGTCRGTVELKLAQFSKAEDVALAFVNALRKQGDRTALGLPGEVLVNLGDRDAPFTVGITDDKLEQNWFFTDL